VKINQMLIGLSVFPLLAGIATAAQPTLLSDTQMDKVTAGTGLPPAGFVTGSIQLTTHIGISGTPTSFNINLTYGIFADCDICNAALSVIVPAP
jgi:hypothetical protein